MAHSRYRFSISVFPRPTPSCRRSIILGNKHGDEKAVLDAQLLSLHGVCVAEHSNRLTHLATFFIGRHRWFSRDRNLAAADI